jgi:nucleoside-diphosphate-sugar epimerase
MRVFVAGATGVVGRALMPMLLKAGHEVTAMGRDAARQDALRQTGARTANVVVFDRGRLFPPCRPRSRMS